MAIRAMVATVAGLVVAAPATAYTVRHVAQQASDEAPAQVATQSSQGRVVSTVARCAPTGREVPGLEGMRNHGELVEAAAQGQTVTVYGRSYDLSRPEDAEALCSALATAQPTGAATSPGHDDPRGAGKVEQRRDAGPRANGTETPRPTATTVRPDGDRQDGSGPSGR